MSEDTSKSVEDIALLLVIQDPGDAQGFELLKDMFAQASNDAAVSGHHDLARAFSVVAEHPVTKDNVVLFELMNALVTKAQEYLRDPSSVTFDTVSNANSGWAKDLDAGADPALLVEFIEKHSLLMDEFESHLMDVATKDSPSDADCKELHAFVKSYLHNVKGDAGSVGFFGIERATHGVEDYLTTHQSNRAIDQLLAYREWVLSVTSAYCQKSPPAELAEDFLNRVVRVSDPGVVRLNEPAESETTVVEAAGVTQAPEQQTMPEHVNRTYVLEGELDILTEFIAEAEDHLNALEESLLDSHGQSLSRDQLDAVFRAVHSLKGGSAYFKLLETTDASHLLENLLDRTRNGQVTFNDELYRITLSYIDIQRNIFARSRAAMTASKPMDYLSQTTELIHRIKLFNDSVTGQASPTGNPKVTQKEASKASTARIDPKVEAHIEAEVVHSAPKSPAPESAAASAAPASHGKATEVKNFVKVDTQRLDLLIEYIGEMVISSSMLIQTSRRLLSDNETVLNNTHQLEQITREIQEIGMSMRLVPIKGLFQKMSRLVWDTSKKLGKDITFTMDGEDTELDRTVIEKIADPLMHMVRNSLDHGIESTAEDRVNAGKSRSGTVELSAFHSGGSVFVRIRDDGRGLDQERLLKKAIEKGIITPEAKLSEQEIFQLIFAPGFSTAATVTDISGRGVGMDVVRRNIEEMRGRIHIESTLGKGATFTVELPLTLAILDGIEAVIGNERYIVPALSVIEFVRPVSQNIKYTLDRGETLRFRDTFLPVFRLGELFGIDTRRKDLSECIIMVVEGNGEQVAVVFDAVVGKLPAVIKSLGQIFRNVKGLAGCAVMPDGGIGLIVDIPTIVQIGRTDRDAPTNRSFSHQGEFGTVH